MQDGGRDDLPLIRFNQRRISFFPLFDFFLVSLKGKDDLILRNEVQGVLVVSINQVDFFILPGSIEIDDFMTEVFDLSESEMVPQIRVIFFPLVVFVCVMTDSFGTDQKKLIVLCLSF